MSLPASTVINSDSNMSQPDLRQFDAFIHDIFKKRMLSKSEELFLGRLYMSLEAINNAVAAFFRFNVSPVDGTRTLSKYDIEKPIEEGPIKIMLTASQRAYCMAFSKTMYLSHSLDAGDALLIRMGKEEKINLMGSKDTFNDKWALVYLQTIKAYFPSKLLLSELLLSTGNIVVEVIDTLQRNIHTLRRVILDEEQNSWYERDLALVWLIAYAEQYGYGCDEKKLYQKLLEYCEKVRQDIIVKKLTSDQQKRCFEDDFKAGILFPCSRSKGYIDTCIRMFDNHKASGVYETLMRDAWTDLCERMFKNPVLDYLKLLKTCDNNDNYIADLMSECTL